jgi:hypothetical protein
MRDGGRVEDLKTLLGSDYAKIERLGPRPVQTTTSQSPATGEKRAANNAPEVIDLTIVTVARSSFKEGSFGYLLDLFCTLRTSKLDYQNVPTTKKWEAKGEGVNLPWS